MRRGVAVVATALVVAGLPVLAGWAAALAAGPDAGRPTFPLLLALGAAPMVALLGAVGAALWLAARARVGRRPLLAAASALATLAGMMGGVYLHVLSRAWLAGGVGLPPLALLFRVDDFARAVPLIPAGLLLGSVVGPLAAGRTRALGVATAFAGGVALAAAAGLATAVPVAVAALVGSAGTFLLFGILVVLVAFVAARRDRSGSEAGS